MQNKRVFQLQLIKVHNPFDRRDKDYVVIKSPSNNLLEIRNNNFPLGIEVTASINGRVVPKDEWSCTYVNEGDQILLIPEVLGGGGGGKTVLRAVLFVAVSVASWGIGSAIAGGWLTGTAFGTAIGSGAAWGFGSVLAASAVAIGGSLLVNSLLPAPGPKLDASLDLSPSYSWNPATTQQQGLAVPHYYGRTKVQGNIIAGYTEQQEDNHYIFALISLGMGPIKSINEEYITINNQKNPTQVYRGVDIETRLGTLNQPLIQNMPTSIVEYMHGTVVSSAGPLNITTQDPISKAAYITINFPFGIYSLNDEGRKRVHTVSYRIEAKPSSYADIPSNWEVITMLPETVETTGSARWSAGYWTQAHDNGVESVWHEVAAGSSNRNDHYAGELYDYSDPDSKVKWRWWTSPVTTVTQWKDYNTVTGNWSKPFYSKWFVRTPLAEVYNIRITRLTADTTDPDKYIEEFRLYSIKEMVSTLQTYPLEALVCIKALATDQLSGSLGFSTIIEGKIINTYDGNSWTLKYSNNPAWVGFDILTRPVIGGTGTLSDPYTIVKYRGLNPSFLSTESFLDWATHCDEIIASGGKRIEFNGGFDATTSAWDAFVAVCEMSRAAPVWMGTTLNIVLEKPTQPTQLFSVGDIKEGSFQEIFIPIEDRATELEVDFINQDNDFEREAMIAFDSDADSSNNKVDLQVLGITDPEQLWYYAQLRINMNKYLHRLISFEVGISAISSTVGDVCYVQHDVPEWGYGGRLVGVAANTLTLDRNVTFEPGKSYKIMIKQASSDDVYIKSLINPATTGDVVTNEVESTTPFSSGFLESHTPFLEEDMTFLEESSGEGSASKYDIFTFGETTLVSKPMRILGINRTDDLFIEISGIDYNETIYNSDLGLPVLDTINYSTIDNLPDVYNLSAREGLDKERDGTIYPYVEVSFSKPNSSTFSHVEIWVSINGGGYTYETETMDNVARFKAIDLVTYTIKVRTVNTLNQKQYLANSPSISIYTLGETAPPPDVDNFFVFIQSDGTREFSWVMNSPPIDLAGYIIKYGSGFGVTWENMQTLHTNVIVSSPWEHNQLLAGDYTFGIKAVDRTGHTSVNANYVNISMGDPRLAGVLMQVEEGDGVWAGTKTNCIVMPTGELAPTDTGTYNDLTTWDNYTRWIINPASSIIYERELDIGAITTVTPLVSLNANGSNTIEESHSDDGISYSPYATVAGTVRARYIKFRITISGEIPTLSKLILTISAKTTTEEFEDLDTSTLTGSYRIGVGDIRLPITVPFVFIKRIKNFTIQDVSGTWTWTWKDKDSPDTLAIGPRIQIFNNGTLADAIIDADVEGIK